MAPCPDTFAPVMKDNYTDTLSAAGTLTGMFTEGSEVTMEDVDELMFAYARDILKNARVRDMVVTTVSEAIKKAMDESGYEYDMGWSEGKIQLTVKMPYDRVAVFYFAVDPGIDRINTLKESLDMISAALSLSGGFSVR